LSIAEQLIADEPHSSQNQDAHALSLLMLGASQVASNEGERARLMLAGALEAWSRLLREIPNDARYQTAVEQTVRLLALVDPKLAKEKLSELVSEGLIPEDALDNPGGGQ